ncbi:MAG: zinc protease [Bradymonadia bacterium]|jgi:zinc protease
MTRRFSSRGLSRSVAAVRGTARRAALGAALLGCATFSLPGAANAEMLAPDYSHIHQRVMDNGLTVVVLENQAVPIVTIEIAARNGAFTEPPELNGLSHLYEHMFFKANALIPNQESYLARIRQLGMVFNGTTSSERVNYYFTLQRHNLREGLEFMAAAIKTPAFDEGELEREREVVLGEYDRNEANPYYFMFEAIAELLWYEYPTRKDSLGDRVTISTATVEQMQWMQETYYIPNNSLLILSGAVSPEDGFAMAEEFFADWERGEDPFEAYPIPEHPPLQGTRGVVVQQPVSAPVVQLAWHGPDTRNDIDATYAADVFSFILSQTGSEFQEALVESGVALGASIGYSTQRYVGPISLTLQVTPDNVERAIEIANEQIALFANDDYFTDAQMETAQTLLAIDDLYGQQRTDNLAHTLSYWWCTASLDYYLTYLDQLAAVERSDIRDYVNEYIIGQPRVSVLLADEAAIGAAGFTDEWLTERIVAGVEVAQ